MIEIVGYLCLLHRRRSSRAEERQHAAGASTYLSFGLSPLTDGQDTRIDKGHDLRLPVTPQKCIGKITGWIRVGNSSWPHPDFILCLRSAPIHR